MANLFCKVSVLMALDFPALERPAKITSKPWSSGQPLSDGHESKNLA
ncbi:hypothetical protein MNB_SUP05-9-354 [hydrothermal vent metagenome]|uniref:Uncharacterized protein n=1 Tax=hydrothermal vent metagenome TaxID=652676 RepID=A0A1W1DRT0_9ZZZZ